MHDLRAKACATRSKAAIAAGWQSPKAWRPILRPAMRSTANCADPSCPAMQSSQLSMHHAMWIASIQAACAWSNTRRGSPLSLSSSLALAIATPLRLADTQGMELPCKGLALGLRQELQTAFLESGAKHAHAGVVQAHVLGQADTKGVELLCQSVVLGLRQELRPFCLD